MLRIRFAAEDLVRIRIRTDPDPLWEVLLSLHMLQTQHGVLPFSSWRRRSRAVLPASTELLTVLAPPSGYSPDFLTPPVDSGDLETGLERLLSTSRRQLRADIGSLADQTTLPLWVSALADGEPDMLRRLADEIRQYHATVLRPHWTSIEAHIHADRARRSALAMDSGSEHLLNTLHPAIRWRPPFLEVTYPVDQELDLGGRGLVLAPAFFCWQSPITLADPDRRPTLVYPVDHDVDWMNPRTGSAGDELSPPARQSLAALLGRTRATVLHTIADHPHLNTTELAQTVGISPAGASQHATVLRNAGLVSTHRHNGNAVHSLASRGAALLERVD